MLDIDLSLYVIVDPGVEEIMPLERFLNEICSGGATCLQVRCKDVSTRSWLIFTRRVISGAHAHGVPVIVNDRLDIALAARAKGVHLGRDDLPVAEARRIAPEGFVIGASVRCLDEALLAARDGADYLGVGPIFASPTKPDLEPIPAGTIREITSEISLPIVAIGGINHMNATLPVSEGADGVAVISALRQCESLRDAAAKLREAVDRAKKG